MTREAKIGMLTGLGVILLIGVLLSNYLGDGKGPSPTGMAALPISAAYRQQVMQPVAAPGTLSNMQSDGVAIASTYEAKNATGAVPALYASNRADVVAPIGPTVGHAVTPVAAGPAPTETANDGSVPTIALPEPRAAVAVAALADGGTMPVKAASTDITYVVGAGDTLMKIARKFYGSDASPADVQRIVVANPTVLKDSTTMLTIGKKLVIANVPAAPVPTPKPVQSSIAAKADGPGIISLPGSPTPKVAVAGMADGKKAISAKTYVVQAGDTLEKIARKFAPSNSSQLVAKLKTANGIKDPTALQIGMTLKVPV